MGNYKKENNRFSSNSSSDKFKVVLLSIDLLTTMSTSGYICFGILSSAFLFRSFTGEININKLILSFLPISLLSILLEIESEYQIIASKAINRQGSFGTRYVDTITGYKIAFNKPLFGYGALGDPNIAWAMNNINIESRSNGMSNTLLQSGFIFMLFYILRFYQKIKLITKSTISSILIGIMFIIFFNTEPIMTLPIFLLFIFSWDIYR